jgi:DNA (cytosine-5)-methyltransferase 1
LNVLDLFSGIGGFSLGLERAGMRTVAFSEIEPYCRKVLAQHWSGVPIYEDVRMLTGARLAADGIAADLVCGGFPCQDVSIAGKRAGIAEGTRSGLWSHFARIIGDVQPKYVVVENVANLLSGPPERPGGWFGRILGDLATLGYNAEWHCIPASAVGAPHPRDRVWIVAYDAFRRRCDRTLEIAGEGGADGTQIPPGGLRGDVSHADGSGRIEQRRTIPIPAQLFAAECGDWWRAEPDVGRVVDGLPFRVDRLKALGNALVPQIAEIIGRAIMAREAIIND